ncbi:putative F-box protein PP2-B12 [Vicia villosa]|uniref:putative F-box protein PP2-B12 n=1 Tax=Vicia villosa TaxID=3911 RepID=UPI00273BC890|nr:putative F-box protein PP2-B12 [Vicia villosa]
MAKFETLPEGCIATILSHTTPIDACRLSLVSKTFRSAADSDTVWNKFLQSDTPFMNYIFSHSSTLANLPTKKALYMSLCDCPLIIRYGQKSFQLVRKNGKRCFMLAARYLHFFWSFPNEYLEWTSEPDSRFPEIAKLRNVSMLKIYGMINTITLSSSTWYEVYVVFKKTDIWVVEHEPVEFLVGIQGYNNVSVDRNLEWQYPSVRSDGWLEIKMGEFFNLRHEDLHMYVYEIKGCNWTSSLSLEGIEVRPMHMHDT